MSEELGPAFGELAEVLRKGCEVLDLIVKAFRNADAQKTEDARDDK